MRIVTVLLVFVCSLYLYGAPRQSLFVKLDLSTNHEMVGDYSTESYKTVTGTGIHFGFEGFYHYDEDQMFGVGVEFWMPHELDDPDYTPEFSFMPVYWTGAWKTKTSETFEFYIGGQFGMNISFTGNDDYSGGITLTPGFYAAFMLGGIYSDKTRIELRRASYSGEASLSGIGSADIYHTENSIVIGFLF